MRFQDKVALVVGGNSGIGLEVTKGLSAEGAKVFATGRSRKTLDEAQALLPGIEVFQADMAEITSLGPVFERAGKIDILIINAGVGGFAPIADVTAGFWDDIHNINLRGAFFTLQQALPYLNDGGSVVFTGSIGAVMGLPGNAVYAAAKAGLKALVRCAAAELVGRKIRVNMVSPGPTETPIMQRNPGMDKADIEQLRANMISNVPMRRLGDADEVANAILFLASQDASFITAVDLNVDGGAVEIR